MKYRYLVNRILFPKRVIISMNFFILNTMDIEDCVMALVYKCEQENKKLVDILEEVLTIKKEYYSKD